MFLGIYIDIVMFLLFLSIWCSYFYVFKVFTCLHLYFHVFVFIFHVFIFIFLCFYVYISCIYVFTFRFLCISVYIFMYLHICVYIFMYLCIVLCMLYIVWQYSAVFRQRVTLELKLFLTYVKNGVTKAPPLFQVNSAHGPCKSFQFDFISIALLKNRHCPVAALQKSIYRKTL